MHMWDKKILKKFTHQLRLPSAKVRGRVGVKILFCAFQPFLNSPQNSEYFEYRHIGSNKKISPCRMPQTKSPAPTKPIVLYNHFGVCKGGGTPPLGPGPDQDRPRELFAQSNFLCTRNTWHLANFFQLHTRTTQRDISFEPQAGCLDLGCLPICGKPLCNWQGVGAQTFGSCTRGST